MLKETKNYITTQSTVPSTRREFLEEPSAKIVQNDGLVLLSFSVNGGRKNSEKMGIIYLNALITAVNKTQFVITDTMLRFNKLDSDSTSQ